VVFPRHYLEFTVMTVRFGWPSAPLGFLDRILLQRDKDTYGLVISTGDGHCAMEWTVPTRRTNPPCA